MMDTTDQSTTVPKYPSLPRNRSSCCSLMLMLAGMLEDCNDAKVAAVGEVVIMVRIGVEYCTLRSNVVDDIRTKETAEK